MALQQKTKQTDKNENIESKDKKNKKDNIKETSKETSKEVDKKEKEKEKQINEELYKNIVLDEYIYLKPTDLNFKIDNIILTKLKWKVEGKCHKVGYIIPNSIVIQSRSLGMINNASFDGMTTYKVIFTCDVCNPVIGQIIQCKVGNIDKSQVICYIGESEISPIEIYLFKQNHVGNTEFAALKNNDIINVKIGGNQWGYNDKQINSIAQFVNLV
jgi:DNA-directed RNA polymerase subunit E'/Rpb7